MKNFVLFLIVAIIIGLMIPFPHVMLNPGELSKAHQKMNNKCMDCHQPFKGITNEKCIACHKLPEIGIDTIAGEKQILFHEQLANEKCTACHSEHKGLIPETTLSGFKHELLTETSLNQCSSCHRQPAGDLHKTLSTACNNCHNTKGWKLNVVFNHDMIQEADKNNCSACHQKPKDSYHTLLKGNCSQCHTNTKWVPSTFNHSNYFSLNGDHNAACNTCHTSNNFTIYTCFSCHEHTESNILAEHREEGITNISNCASCHKSGSEHEGEGNENNRNNLNQQDLNGVKNYIQKDGKREHDDD